MNSRRALAAPIACGCCLLAGAVYVAIDDPADGGAFLPCPFRTLTGLWCPGCGLTRATHRLLRGDLIEALRYNLFVIVVLGSIIAAWAGWMAAAAGRPLGWPGADRSERSRAVLAGCVVLVAGAFTVVRNLPSVSGLRG